MKRGTRRVIIPQYDFKWPDEPFALMREVAVDGERVAGEAKRLEADRAESAKQQTDIHDAGMSRGAKLAAAIAEDTRLIDLPTVLEPGWDKDGGMAGLRKGSRWNGGGK